MTYVEPNISEKRSNEKRKRKHLIHRIQKMSRLALVRYSSNYYMNIFHHHIHFLIKFLIKSQLR